MSVLETDDYQSERELLQPKSYNTFDYSRNTAKKDEYHSKKVSPPPTRSGVNYINVEDEDQMEIYGYTPNFAKTLLTWTLILLTGGLLRLLFHWKPHWMLLCTHNLCSLEYAKKVLLIDHFHQKFTETVVCLSNDRLSYHNAHGAAAAAADQQNTSTTSATAVGDDPEDQHWITVPRPYGVFEHVSSITYFENKKVRYIWDRNAKEFLKLGGLDREIKCTYFYQQKGLSAEHQRRRQVVYGLNQIVVTVQSVYGILISEVLEPFYIFQIFSLVIWSFDAYYYYASCIVIMSALSLTSSVIQTRRNQKQLRDTVQGTDSVMVYRGGEGGGGGSTGADYYEKVESSQLVPGDIIEVPSFGCIMQCDAVLISGNVIINEAMLTGESVPVTKTPLPSTTLHMLYDSKEHAKHTLFCGTKVIQTRYYNNVKVRAVIIRTGYQTAKGELVRSIMFPKPVDFKFNRHIHQFIGFLSFLALIGFVYTIILKAYRGVYLTQIMLKALDLITIIIPPALPAAMTIGVVFAQSRLRKAEIFCISPRSINISGCINCVCFDKTGTLTEDDLNFSEVVPVAETAAGLRLSAAVHHPVTGLEYGPLMISLAVCHSLTLIEGKIIGDPLDQKMFAATEWILEEPDVNDTTKYDLLAPTVVKPPTDSADKEVGILRQFPFSSSLQRMSVIARQVRGTQFELYAKGAPEMIQSLCDPRSLPADFSSRLQEYTEKGYRVLGLAYRPLASMNYSKVQRAAREDLEKNLTFVGLLVMGNMLKPETTHVIETLLMANIRSVMVTGDNMLTALSVARECSMIQPWHKVILLEDGPGPGAPAAAESEGEEAVPTIHWKFANSMAHIPDINFKLASAEDRDRIHIAVTGRTFKVLREHYPEVLKKVAVRGTVFARMAPEQKQQLIELLQELGYYVGMCGDGANDCGALKAAHAGVSLSETEASVASPFTSKQPNIGCIPTLIQEGRASIVTAFGILKYMACYSLTQFISVIILYTFYSNLTDKEFLYIDLFLITLFVTLFGRNKAFKQLNRNPPPSSLIGLTPLSSIVLQILLVLLMQVLAIVIVQAQPWYRPHVTHNQEDLASHDNYALFASSVFQYITLAVVFSKGKPYRQPLYSNQLFLLSLLAMTVLTGALVIYPPHFIAHFFELDIIGVPISFRTLMVLLAVAHFFLANLVEAFVVDYLLFKKLKQWFAFLAPSHLPYEKIEGETRNNTLWLPNPPQNTPILERTTTSSLSTTTTSDASSNHSRLGPLGGDGSGSHVVLNGSAAHHRGHHQQQQRLDGGSDHLEQATSQFSIV